VTDALHGAATVQEVTGGLDEEEIRKVEKEYEYQRRLELRKEATISAIAKQGKLTDEVWSLGLRVVIKLLRT
jgi:transcriptional accessory protein Tex/SPT6